MTKFERKFDVEAIEKVVDAQENAWFRDLLKRWCPAGNGGAEAKADHLRLAVRNGYLNFYRAGQSVAKVNIDRTTGNLQARVHKKYVGEDALAQDYVLLREGKYTKADGSKERYREELLCKWIKAADNEIYVKKEKRFVDLLVAKNPGVIDLEAGLPWDSHIWKKKSAKRIDIVALEPCGDRYKLVFWEAKLVTNPEARSSTEPEVWGQVERYQNWLEKYQIDVRSAYQATCAVLARIHGIARARKLNAWQLGTAVSAVATQEPSQLLLEVKPRLIIDGRRDNKAFVQNGHLEQLRAHGIQVQMVRGETEMALSAKA